MITLETQDHREIYKLVIEASSIISAFGCLFILLTFLVITKLQSSYNKLICFLSLTSLIYSSSYLLTFFENDSQQGLICTIQGCMMQYSFNATSLVVLTISYSLYQKIVRKSDIVEKNLKLFMFSCFVLPGFISAYFLYINAYVPTGDWCFLNMNEDYLQSAISVHGLYIVCAFFTTLFYLRIFSNLRDEYQLSKQNIYLKVYSRIKWYPILLILCFTPILVLRHLDHFGIKIDELFIVIAGVLACLNGFLNGIFYALNKKTRKTFGKFCCGDTSKSEIKANLLSQ